jgi:3-methyladenine DNA glycosylase AlkD
MTSCNKACGWMPRETGRRNESVLRGFLDAKHMPRTMLRYALEKLPDYDRRHYMGR